MELATRYNQRKPQWSLVDFNSFEPLVRVLEFGLEKYGRDNWKKGLPTHQITESLLRHAFAYLRGEKIDKESGLSHIGHMQANLMFLQYVETNKPHLDTIRHEQNKEPINDGNENTTSILGGGPLV